MKYIYTWITVFLIMLLAGCAAQKQLAQNLQRKSLMGDGIVTVNEIVLTSPETGTYTPEIKSIFISGKFLSLLKDANFISYDRKSTASTFNASAVTTTETLVIQTAKNSDLSEVVKQLGKLMGAQPNKGSASTETPSKATQ